MIGYVNLNRPVKIWAKTISFLLLGLFLLGEGTPVSATEKESNLVVSPTLQLDEMIAKFEMDAKDVIEDAEIKAEVLKMEERLRDKKKRGGTQWGSGKWIKDEEHYRGLDTCKLAEECFSEPIRGIFIVELMKWSRPIYAFTTFKIMHNGFAELFKREDMWKGILHAYAYLTSELDPQKESREYMRVGLALGYLYALYEQVPEFKEQVKGRERLFLDANINALKKFKSCMEWIENHNKKAASFYRAPCMVANTALMLCKQVDPQGYEKINHEITGIRFPGEQRREDMIYFLDVVIKSFDRALIEK